MIGAEWEEEGGGRGGGDVAEVVGGDGGGREGVGGCGVCGAAGTRTRDGARAFGVLPAAPADGDVAEGAAVGPVAAARLAEVARLREVIVIVVTELGVGGVAPRAAEVLRLRRWRSYLLLFRSPPLITVI